MSANAQGPESPSHRTCFLLAIALALAPLRVHGSADRIALSDVADGTPARSFVDGSGRIRVFHGANVVVKGPPWIPDVSTFSTDISLTEEDFDRMDMLGLNVIRLGVMWPGVEPKRGEYNETYLDIVEGIVTNAAKHGIYTLLDMHEDVLSEKFCGEGIPEWAVMEDGGAHPFDSFPSPLSDAFNDSYIEPRSNDASFPTRQDCAKFEWTQYFVAEDTAGAYQALYDNVNGIRDAWGNMWAHVVGRLQHLDSVLGVELINEPFAGDFYHHPLSMVPYPNPLNADRRFLEPAYDALNQVIREVDDSVLLFFAGVTWDDFGIGVSQPPGGFDYANRSVLAYHYYTPPQRSAVVQVDAMMRSAKRLQTGAMLTETCAPSCNGHFNSEDGVGDATDAFLQSWATWEWKTFCRETDETLASKSQNGVWGACKTGYGPTWNETDAMPPNARDFARTYATAIAGTGAMMVYNDTTREFMLKFTTEPSISAPTEIFVSPEYKYSNGFNVAIDPQDALQVSYDTNVNPRKVFLTGVGSAPTTVSVLISPKDQ